MRARRNEILDAHHACIMKERITAAPLAWLRRVRSARWSRAPASARHCRAPAASTSSAYPARRASLLGGDEVVDQGVIAAREALDVAQKVAAAARVDRTRAQRGRLCAQEHRQRQQRRQAPLNHVERSETEHAQAGSAASGAAFDQHGRAGRCFVGRAFDRLDDARQDRQVERVVQRARVFVACDRRVRLAL